MNRQAFDTMFGKFVDLNRADGRFKALAADHPILDEDTASTTPHISWDYLLHNSWAAREIARFNPKKHHDFSSYAYLAGIVSAFVPVDFYDIRPLNMALPNLYSGAANLTALPLETDSLESISCLHVIEHCGLGRYGDELDAQGDLKAARELARVLKPGGQLLMVTPMHEKPHIRYNADRYYSREMVMAMFEPTLKLRNFCFIYDDRIQRGQIPQDGHYTGCMVWGKNCIHTSAS